MSVLDSFASLVAEAPVPAPRPAPLPTGGSSVLDSFASLDGEAEAPVPAPRPTERKDNVHAAVVSPSGVLFEPTLEKQQPSTRGRKKGSTADVCALRRLLDTPEPVAAVAAALGPRSRREICSAAGKARAAKQKAAAAGASAGGSKRRSSSTPAAMSTDLVLVPADAGRRGGAISLYDDSSQVPRTIMKWEPGPKFDAAKSTKIECGVLQSCLGIVSKSELAKKLGCSRQVVTRRLRLLATCVIFLRKLRAEDRLKFTKEYLQLVYGADSVEEMLFMVKYKYDEFSMRCRGLAGSNSEVAVMKLVNIQVFWIALYKVKDRYVRLRQWLPSIVRGIEANDTNCMRAVLDGPTTFAPQTDSFKRKTRMPICDKHGANIATDNSYYRDYTDQKLHRFHCFSHVGHKHAEKICNVFPNERRGLLHSCLAFNFGGTLTLIKKCMKQVNRKDFSWFDATEGPGADHDAHREAVWKQCMEVDGDDCRELGTGKIALFFRRKQKWNGRYQLRGRTEHFCFSRSCCTGPDDCLNQMDEIIDEETGPGYWDPHRFLKVEDTLDWEIFWTECHGIFDDSVEMALGDLLKQQTDPATLQPDAGPDSIEAPEDLAEEGEEGHEEWHLPEEDLGLAEPLKDDSQLQRQSTFRKNTLVWVRSKPGGRLWLFRSLLGVQQSDQRRLVEYSGEGWLAREMNRRCKGKKPRYRVTKAAQGVFHKSAISKWSCMMRKEDCWIGLPAAFRRHDLAVHAYRGLAAALCNKYELEAKVFGTYPFYPYLMLDDSVLGEDMIVAIQVSADFQANPCLFCPQWYAHVEEFPTPERLLCNDSKALMAVRGDEGELDNLSAEASNANCHRIIKRALQQKLASIDDVSAASVLRLDRAIHSNLWGERKYPPDMQVTPLRPKKAKKRGGGGGLCRAFVSHAANTVAMSGPDGRPDFSRISAAYKHERSLPHSEILEALRADAKTATQARREQVEQGQRWQISSFGRLTHRAVQNEARLRELKALQDATGEVEHPSDADRSADGGAVVPYRKPDLASQLATLAGGRLPDQVAAFRRLARHKATVARREREAITEEVRKELKEPKQLLGQKLEASQYCSPDTLRTLDDGRIFDVYYHENIADEVQAKVATISKSAPAVVKACETLWKGSHTLILKDTANNVGTVPAWAKPTYCHQHGCGLCLCKGHGLIAKLMSDNLARQICKRAPKDSEFRRLLTTAFALFHIGDCICSFQVRNGSSSISLRQLSSRAALLPSWSCKQPGNQFVAPGCGSDQLGSKLECLTVAGLASVVVCSLFRKPNLRHQMVECRDSQVSTAETYIYRSGGHGGLGVGPQSGQTKVRHQRRRGFEDCARGAVGVEPC